MDLKADRQTLHLAITVWRSKRTDFGPCNRARRPSICCAPRKRRLREVARRIATNPEPADTDRPFGERFAGRSSAPLAA